MLKITQQPSSTAVVAGQSATIECRAEGDNVKVQWFYRYRSGQLVAIGGANISTLTFTTSPPREDRPLPFTYPTGFLCRASSGGQSVDSEVVTVTCIESIGAL